MERAGSPDPNCDNPFSAKSLPGLDGLRAIAIVIVVLSHYLPPYPWLPDGQFGVLLFFVLSGFLITWLLMKELRVSGTISLSGFYTRRAWRILPAFYLSAFIAMGVGVLSGLGVHWREFLAASLFASNYFYALTGQTGEKVLGVTWSLSLEEQFYLLWPCVLLFSRHHISILRKVLVPCIALIWIYRSAGWGLGHFSQQYVLYSFETRVDAILIGALGALSVSEGSKWWRTISNPTCMAVAAIGLVLCPLLGQRLGIQWFFGPGLIAGCLLSGLLVLQSIVLAPAVLTSRPISWGR